MNKLSLFKPCCLALVMNTDVLCIDGYNRTEHPLAISINQCAPLESDVPLLSNDFLLDQAIKHIKQKTLHPQTKLGYFLSPNRETAETPVSVTRFRMNSHYHYACNLDGSHLVYFTMANKFNHAIDEKLALKGIQKKEHITPYPQLSGELRKYFQDHAINYGPFLEANFISLNGKLILLENLPANNSSLQRELMYIIEDH